jgi:single-stranded-DNA-specific exonuclease
LSIDGDIAHGSCRSIAGFDMLACLESCAPLMKRFGGHKAAAGLQLESARIKEFRLAVNAHADTCLGPDDLRPRLWLDGPLALHDLNERVMNEFAALAPFGPGNPRPRFHTGPVALVDGPRLLKERHLKMSVKQNGRVLRAIQWNAAERESALLEKKEGVEIAYTVEENEYQGNKYVELRLEDFR